MKRVCYLFAVILSAGLLIAGCGSSPVTSSGDTAAGGAAISIPAEIEENPFITIVNDTGYEVWYLYISSSDQDTWGEDWLDSDQVLSDGQSITIQMLYPLSVCNSYDIMLVDLDGDAYTKYSVTISANGRIVFIFDDFDWDDYH